MTPEETEDLFCANEAELEERIARAINPGLWQVWDDRANRHKQSEKILAPSIEDSLKTARRVIAAVTNNAEV